MATTIIAIYGAVLATLSTLLGAWYYLHSGPRLQAEAIAFYPLDEDDRVTRKVVSACQLGFLAAGILWALS